MKPFQEGARGGSWRRELHPLHPLACLEGSRHSPRGIMGASNHRVPQAKNRHHKNTATRVMGKDTPGYCTIGAREVR